MKLRLVVVIGVCGALNAAGMAVAGARGTSHRHVRAAAAARTLGIKRPRPVTVGRPGLALAPVRVSDPTAESISVRVWPVLLHQDLDGSFAFSESPTDLASAAQTLRVNATSFSLIPAQTRSVGLTWRRVSPASGGAYVGLVARGLPWIRPDGMPTTSDHLIAVRLLDLPGGHASGGFTRIALARGPGTSLHFIPQVVNTGTRVGAPSNASLTILDAQHAVVLRKVWHGDVVLPGAHRDFIVPVRMQLPAGGYTAIATMGFGRVRHVQSATPFTLVAPNVPAVRTVTLRDLAVRADTGHQAHVSATLASTGNAPSATTVTVALSRLDNGQPVGEALATRSFRLHDLVPGSSRRISVTLGPRLAPGTFRVSISYHDRPFSQVSTEDDFPADQHLPLLALVRRFIKHNVVLSALMGVLLALLAVAASAGASIRWQRWRAAKATAALRARQERLAAELAGTAASRARQRRLAAELASAAASRTKQRRRADELALMEASTPREEELAAELTAAVISERRRRQQAARLAVHCLATAKATRVERRARQLV